MIKTAEDIASFWTTDQIAAAIQELTERLAADPKPYGHEYTALETAKNRLHSALMIRMADDVLDSVLPT